MTKLTPTQTDLLNAAADADSGAIDAPTNTKAYAALIKRGLMISDPLADGECRLLLTDSGRAAIGRAIVEVAATAVSPSAQQPKGKIGLLVSLLRREEGATIGAMMDATGWQAHSVRGAISGSVKKALGLNVSSENTKTGRLYRIGDGATA